MNALLIEPRVRLEATILTAADRGYFVPLACLVASLRVSHDCRIAVVDLGLTARQRTWCRRNGAIVLAPKKLPVARNVHMWQTWNKPFLLSVAHGRYPDAPLLWIDADCIVTGSLAPFADLASDRPVFFADTGAIAFCGWQEGVRCVSNEPALYHQYPTPTRFEPGGWPNAGVFGVHPNRQRDARIIDEWARMVLIASHDRRLMDKRSQDHAVQGWLSWWDQGALQWALESLEETSVVLADGRFNDPVSCHGANSCDELLRKIGSLKTTRVVHLLGRDKPYRHFSKRFDCDASQYPEKREDLTLLVLGHEPTRLAAVRRVPCVKPINLLALAPPDDLAESRIFRSNRIGECDTEYIGLCTARWNEKYAGHCGGLEKLHRLKLGVSTVWAAHRSSPEWLAESERSHPGMAKIVEHLADKMGVRNIYRGAPWGNNFVAHWSVVAGLQEWWWRCYGLMAAKFGSSPRFSMKGFDTSRRTAYLAERFTMLYFCMRDDLEIKQVPP